MSECVSPKMTSNSMSAGQRGNGEGSRAKCDCRDFPISPPITTLVFSQVKALPEERKMQSKTSHTLNPQCVEEEGFCAYSYVYNYLTYSTQASPSVFNFPFHGTYEFQKRSMLEK